MKAQNEEVNGPPSEALQRVARESAIQYLSQIIKCAGEGGDSNETPKARAKRRKDILETSTKVEDILTTYWITTPKKKVVFK